MDGSIRLRSLLPGGPEAGDEPPFDGTHALGAEIGQTPALLGITPNCRPCDRSVRSVSNQLDVLL
jgi:hypothetical protein